MDIRAISRAMAGCDCGRIHDPGEIDVFIGPGLAAELPQLISSLPRRLLVVADRNTLAAAGDILPLLAKGGFDCRLKLYDNMRTADIKDVRALEALCGDAEGLLSVGTGSLNDICRLASFNAKKPFGIFATAASMDGFAASMAPITFGNFKKSVTCHGPRVIIGDADILAAAPAVLKSAGFGDMVAKYVALVDWQIARIAAGEDYCGRVAALVKEALERVVGLADKVTTDCRDTAAALMEGLVMTGLAINLAQATRPASGAEHIVSHFWEIMKLKAGEESDFHGKKVGVATLLTVRLYHEIANREVNFRPDATDWEAVYAAYGPDFREEIETCRRESVAEKIDLAQLARDWPEICRIVREELPDAAEIASLLKAAGAAADIGEIGVDEELAAAAMKYHPYMRSRVNLSRLV